MIFDVDRHVAVQSYSEIFPFMEHSWQKHFERKEFVGSIAESSNHIRVSSRFGDAPESAPALVEADHTLLVPHQALTVNGWADNVAAVVFVEAFNSFAAENWVSEKSAPAIVVSAADPEWSAREITRRAGDGGFGAVALPLGATLAGSKYYDPIYEAASNAGLPIVFHFSGVEGFYDGAPGLGGGIHQTAFSRLVLLPQLAESTITSLAFEGVFERFPQLRVVFSGFGFSWLPSLLWRLDREWRTFRHDVPWVKRVPSEYVLENVWLTTWPLQEATMDDDWHRLFSTETLRSRIVFGSHAPFDGDAPSDVVEQLGETDAALVLGNGAALLPFVSVRA
ncbi:MAG: hypothetical protein JWQ19_1449 [Subtercola sp.]|nr:hypothetical protein [Subtercola sp.]